MRWPWQRRSHVSSGARVATNTRRTAERDSEHRDPVLAFAQAYWTVAGARTRLTGTTLQAALPDGKTRICTMSAGATNDDTELLAPGSPALARMLADVEGRAHLSSLRLSRASDPETLVRSALAAAPRDCGRCLSGEVQASFALCGACPLRSDQPCFIVNAPPKRGMLRITEEEMSTSIELMYHVSARDRGGQIDDVVRVAFDLEGRKLPAVTGEQVEAAVAMPLPDTAAKVAPAATTEAEELLRPVLDAVGTVLRMRSADAYRKRLEDVTSTYDRLRREQPEDEQSILASLQRELAALAESYAVDVQATLESVCFVASPVADVSWHSADGPEIAFTVDSGRGTVTSICSSCGHCVERGIICPSGHLMCVKCGPACVVCYGTSPDRREASHHMRSPTGDTTFLATQDLISLAQFTPYLWHQCAIWLLGCAGYSVSDAGSHSGVWHATRDGAPILVAMLSGGRTPSAEDVRRLAEHAAREGAHGLLLALCIVPADVRALAQELGVELIDQAALDALLTHLTTEEKRGSAPTRGEARERIAAAIKTREALLHALEHAAGALSDVAAGERAVGAAALAAALAELDDVRRSASQAFLAWETLVADWLAMFPARVTPSGGLVIDAEKDELRELRERATHLGNALASVFDRLNDTPTKGELGYDAWRTALREEYTAKCTALRARIAAIDPAEWADARRARSPEAEAAAERAIQEARHAAARAAKAHAQVGQLTARGRR